MRAFEATRLNARLPGVRLAAAARATADLEDLAPCAAILVAHAGAGDPGCGARRSPLCRARPPGELRQGHRARNARLHDGGPSAGGAGPPGRDPVRPVLRRRRGGGAADGGDARQRGRRTWRGRCAACCTGRISGSITRPTSAASRSAARRRTCSRSPAASPRAGASARARAPRSSRAASPSCAGSARPSARDP